MSAPDRAEEFVFLLARHERLLGAYVMTMVPHPADADDILQEAKVVMWRNFAKFERGTNFIGWNTGCGGQRGIAEAKGGVGNSERDRLAIRRQCRARRTGAGSGYRTGGDPGQCRLARLG